MAYIAPNTDLKILKGVPIDKSYNHTLLQTSLANQYTMLNTFAKYTLPAFSYQRAGKGKIRVGILADNLYDCNYIMFRNTSYGEKWFYAFIDTPEYINDNTTEISYTIDVMQTWYFDYELGACYVEREHSLTDKIGDNLIPENIDTGDLIPQNKSEYVYGSAGSTTSYEFVVLYTPETDTQAKYVTDWNSNLYDFDTDDVRTRIPDTADKWYRNASMIVNGVYIGCICKGIPFLLGNAIGDTLIKCNKLIEKLTDINANIISILLVPFRIWSDWIGSGSGVIDTKTIAEAVSFYNAGRNKQYLPKNKKMYTYPYHYILVSNNAGESEKYKWENFAKTYSSSGGDGIIGNADFEIMTTAIPTVEVSVYPKDHTGIVHDYEHGVTLTDFPKPPWSIDSFAEWWAQNKESYLLGLISSAIATAGGIALGSLTANVGAMAGTALVGAKRIANKVSEYTAHQHEHHNSKDKQIYPH